MTDLKTADQDAILHLADNIGLLPITIDVGRVNPPAEGHPKSGGSSWRLER